MTDLGRISPGEPDPPGCVHMGNGRELCRDCWDDYCEDPSAYREYGEHPEGIRNWEALQEELAAAPASVARPNDGIPF